MHATNEPRELLMLVSCDAYLLIIVFKLGTSNYWVWMRSLLILPSLYIGGGTGWRGGDWNVLHIHTLECCWTNAGMSFTHTHTPPPPPGSGRDAPRPPSSMPHLHWDQYILSIPPVKFPSAASALTIYLERFGKNVTPTLIIINFVF